MAKSTTINLTPEQREQIRKVTGQEHKSVKVEALSSRGETTLAARQSLQGKGVGLLKARAPLKAKRALKKRFTPSGKMRRGGPGLR